MNEHTPHSREDKCGGTEVHVWQKAEGKERTVPRCGSDEQARSFFSWLFGLVKANTSLRPSSRLKTSAPPRAHKVLLLLYNKLFHMIYGLSSRRLAAAAHLSLAAAPPTWICDPSLTRVLCFDSTLPCSTLQPSRWRISCGPTRFASLPASAVHAQKRLSQSGGWSVRSSSKMRRSEEMRIKMKNLWGIKA